MEVLAPALLVLQLMILQEVSVDTNTPLRMLWQRVEKPCQGLRGVRVSAGSDRVSS